MRLALCYIFVMTPDEQNRFWAKVQKKSENECWDWQGAKNSKGYGQFFTGGSSKSVHRLSYQLHNLAIPDGLIICHRCNNRSCVNPAHLYAGTNFDNMKQASEEKRLHSQSKTHCKNGHEFTPENTVYRKQGKKEGRAPDSVYRYCRACGKEWRKKRKNTPERQKYHAEYWQKYRGIPASLRNVFPPNDKSI